MSKNQQKLRIEAGRNPEAVGAKREALHPRRCSAPTALYNLIYRTPRGIRTPEIRYCKNYLII
jgi:hypothetical protein